MNIYETYTEIGYGIIGVGAELIKVKLVETGRYIYNIIYTTRKIKMNEIKNIHYI